MVLVVGMAMGCVARRPPSPDSPRPATKPTAAIHLPGRTIIGQSVQGRPIELVRFGDAPAPVLVIAAIHGDEPTSKYVADRLIETLAGIPHVNAAIIPCANPDGLAADRRTNDHGVDLNRNFPAANWKKGHPGRTDGGPAPASEPESAALLEVLTALKPRLIISIHSMETPCDNYDGPGKCVAELMSRHNHYPVRATIGYPTPGSLGSWAGIDRSIPIITLELPRHQPGEVAWEANREALVAVLGQFPAPVSASP